MGIVSVRDKQFKVSITAEEIKSRIKEVAAQINADMDGKRPLFLAILNGSFIFAADLYREITVPSEITFVKMASYDGVDTTGVVSDLIGLTQSIEGRHVIIVEDIVDTGITMKHMVEMLKEQNPASVKICSLLTKPEKLQVPLTLDYVAFEIPNLFVVGYGLDYDHEGRNLKDICSVME
ncbi:MAG: hypoxanthine phosphoribosyltransferase [Prevotellaceae bacterium]|nr:hypoxanthine phosphoribosyltransferase [Prevotellaceae bacterium]